jgi:hypothetical protein
MFLTWKPQTNTTSKRRSRWYRSSTTRRSLTTFSSTSRSSPTWPHAPPCMVSSGAVAAWTRSRATAPRCPSSNRGTSWSSPTPAIGMAILPAGSDIRRVRIRAWNLTRGARSYPTRDKIGLGMGFISYLRVSDGYPKLMKLFLAY